jgi:NitT/TauT family transport system ATP-binding protein
MSSALQTAVQLEAVSFAYGSRNGSPEPPLFEDLRVSIRRGCTTAIMGGSGSGKSTLARLLARDLFPQQGTIRWNDDCQRLHDVVYVDQSPLNSVFPWQTVEQNIRWPLKALRRPLAETKETTRHLLGLFRLEHRADAFPAEISGGELQRLALARCISWRPRFAILDESLSALDRATKDIIYEALLKIGQEQGTTFLLITHNLADTMALAERCVILGERPVRILGDFEIPLPFPRQEADQRYRDAQEPLIEVIRRGIL